MTETAGEGWHLAQINVALAVDDLDSSALSGFVARIEEINALADDAEGFVWRLQTEEGDATGIQAFDDPRMIVNMSVWRDLEALRDFVFRSAHLELLRARADWFHKPAEMHQALWWIPAGDLPTVEDGRDRLAHIRKHGPSEKAFSFARAYPPTAVPDQ